MTAKIEYRQHKIFTVAFLQDPNHLLTGSEDGTVRRWQRNGYNLTEVKKYTNAGGDVNCIAVSNDGRWIVAGTDDGIVTVWDAKSHEKVVEMRYSGHILAVDISPDSNWVASGSSDEPVSVWDITASRGGQHLILSRAEHPVVLKFSPDGKRIATAQFGHPIRIFDSVHGKELVHINVYQPPTVLEWTGNGQHIFAVHHGKLSLFDTTTASLQSEQQLGTQDVHQHDHSLGQVALASDRKIVASSTERSITFWDTSTSTQIGQVNGGARYIAFSSDCLHLAAAGQDNKIIICSLSEIVPQCYLNKPAPQLPFLHISDTAFTPWIQNQLEVAEAVLAGEIGHSSVGDAHYTFANRAFIRARQGKWEDARKDAGESLSRQTSICGLVAKSWALVGLNQEKEAVEALELASTLCNANENKLLLLIKYVILCTTGASEDVIKHLATLVGSLNLKPVCLLVQARIYIHLANQFLVRRNYGEVIRSLERACIPVSFQPSPELTLISMFSGWHFEDLRRDIHNILLAIPRTEDLIRPLLSLNGPFPQCLRTTSGVDWIHAFMTYRVEVLEHMGDKASDASQRQEAVSCYTAVLFLGQQTDNTQLLLKWTNALVENGLWKESWNMAAEFGGHKSLIHRAICEKLEATEHLIEATECFRRIECDHTAVPWPIEFKQRLLEKLRNKAHAGTRTLQGHRESIEFYSAALSLRPDSLDLLVGRSELQASIGMWDGAISDADEAIKSDPSSPRGYQAKHAALLGAGRYDDAFETYNTMFSRLDDRALALSLTSIPAIESAIRSEIEHTIRYSPRVLINTTTGRMRNKAQQAAAFTATPDFKALCTSMVSGIDHKRIKEVVAKYYRYVMLSHTWENDEPLFQLVEKTTVYELQKTRENDKLRDFCALARELGYVWAWSDTCCIDKQDQVVLQESLVSMFRWYHGSTLTIVFLRDDSRGLENCRWISRGWTYQEYVAARVIRFYTKDWKPYLGLTRWNHKEVREIRIAMEGKAKSSPELMHFVHELKPGQDDIREKLSLASTRTTTVVEDAAYSLLGIFAVSIPVIYGEGESSALGRLLGHLLTATGDASILAWSGKSGSFNSCLPAQISVFKDLATSYLPQPLGNDELNSQVQRSKRKTLEYRDTVVGLYERLTDLPAPSFAANRMKLSCIMFQLDVSFTPRTTTDSSAHYYRAKNTILGDIDIRTNDRLHPSRDSEVRLYLVYPWLNAVKLGREFEYDKPTRAMRLFARLTQPFWGLLLALTDRGYQRVAADSVIKAQVQQETLGEVEYLRDNARTIDVL